MTSSYHQYIIYYGRNSKMVPRSLEFFLKFTLRLHYPSLQNDCIHTTNSIGGFYFHKATFV